MVLDLKRYFWFIKTSQSYMRGTQSSIKTFLQSLKKGFGFVEMCRVTDYQIEKYGAEVAYAKMDRMIER